MHLSRVISYATSQGI